MLKINPSIAREAYAQAEKRLSDTLETKKGFEQKAFVLFNAFIALALALCGVAATLYKTGGWANNVTPFLFSGLLMVAGAVCFALALLDKEYGALGSDPDMWLNSETIDGEDSTLPLMLAYITHHHKNRIKKSIEANNRKRERIRLGIFVGLAAPVVIVLTLFLP